MVGKLLSDYNYTLDVIVAWAVKCDNALHTCYRYSPNKLLFGRTPKFPSSLPNSLNL